MIQSDVCHRCDQRLDHVGGVQLPPQPHLHDAHLNPGLGEETEGQNRRGLEEGEAVPLVQRLKVACGLHQHLFVDGHSGEPVPFPEGAQVRRGIEAGAMTGCPEDRVPDGSHRALAVGSAHVKSRIGQMGVTNALQDT